MFRAARTLLVLAVAAFLCLAFLIAYPNTPLPDAWNPAKPLSVSDPMTPMTGWKLRRAQTGEACFAALESAEVAFTRLDDFEESDVCHIRDRVRLNGLGQVRVAPFETRCTIALRMALWERHGISPAARAITGQNVAELHHLTSYNCRRLRTSNGPSDRMSTHATADAVDITGVTLADGRRITLIEDWGPTPEGRFLQAIRDSACDVFATTLGPDFNALHRDHFHLQSRGFGTCR